MNLIIFLKRELFAKQTKNCEYLYFNPPSEVRVCVKENGQNPDNGSKNSENKNNDAVL